MGDAQHGDGTAADDEASGGRRGFAAVWWESVLSWVRNDGKRAAITAAIAFAVAWFVNVYIIAVRYEGTSTQPGGAATVSGNRLTGVLFWLVLTTVVLTVVTYAQRVGWSRLGAELKVLPTNLMAAFRTGDPSVQWAALLWGGAVSLVVALLFSTAAAGALGLGLVLLAASPLVATLGRSIRRLGARALSTVAPDRAPLLDTGQVTVATVLGSAVGMAVAWQVGPVLWKAILALAGAAGAAVLLKRGSPVATGATVLLAVLAAVQVQELLGAVVFADDGGWREAGGTLTSWIGSEGSGRVMTQSVMGGLSGAAGAVIGSATGSVVASSASQLAVGGLSGEFGAAEAGATAAAPAVPVAAPTVDPEEEPGVGDQPPPAPDGGGAGADRAGQATTEGDLAVGGLSGEFTGGESDAGSGGGGPAPGRSDHGDDEDDT